jgi:hypothetical protein
VAFSARWILVALLRVTLGGREGRREDVLVGAFQSEREEETGDLPAEPAVA